MKNLFAKIVLWSLLAVLIIDATGLFAQTAFSPPVDVVGAAGTVPSELAKLLPDLQAQAEQDVARLVSENGVDASPSFQVKFFQRTADLRDRSSGAWLVGYSLFQGVGPVTGKEFFKVAITILSDSGERLVRIPTQPFGGETPYDSVYSSGFIVEMGPNKAVAVLSYDGSKYEGSSVVIATVDMSVTRVISLVESPRNLLTDDESRPFWDSTLYFIDVDGDGYRDLLIDRKVSTSSGQTRTELRAFKLTADDSSLAEITSDFARAYR